MKIIKNLFFILIIIIFSRSFIYSYDIGKIIQISGYAERSSITTGKRFKTEVDTIIKYGQKLKIGKGSSAEILLDNGTSIYLKNESAIYFFTLRLNKKDPPTKIKLLYGKARITPKRLFNDRSLILTTQTAAISIVDATFSVIASEYETKVIAYSSKVGVANIHPGYKKAYVIKRGEEISIRKNAPPLLPLRVPDGVIKFWFDYFNITGDHKFIIKSAHEEGLIDWILRKREF